MKIGIDLSPLQGPHRMRGIGYVTRHVLQNIPADVAKNNEFVFYVDKKAEISPEDTVSNLALPKNTSYEFRYITAMPIAVGSKLAKAKTAIKKLNNFKTGSNHFGDTSMLDAFIQFDQSQPFPKLKRSVKKVLIAYDLIPYVLESDYLWNYKTARRNGISRKGSLKVDLRRKMYRQNIVDNARSADEVLAISKTTKRDFEKYLGLPSTKIKTIILGSPEPLSENMVTAEQITFGRYQKTSFGYLTRPYTMDASDDYILFVGGADPRRKLDDLVAAFNQIRARGQKLKLVLAGDTMKGPGAIPVHSAQKALGSTAFTDDVIFAGFIDDTTRNWLYMHARAFVFPSVYEGFGLPVLEAMNYGTPVISYKNTATIEVAGDAPIYADDVASLIDAINKAKKLKNDRKHQTRSQEMSQKYSWTQTAKDIFKYTTQ